jgi:hypothetical protein
MLTVYLPFLTSASTLGVICLLVFLASSVILTIPVFATRGATQAIWLGAVGFALTVEVAILVALVALQSSGHLNW